jgi:hypothetical protein
MPKSQSIDFHVYCQKRGGILHFQVSGDIDSQAVRMAYWQNIAEITRQHGLRKLLITDRKKHKPASPAEVAELASMLKIYVSLVDMVAIVEPTAQFVSAMEHAEIEGRAVGMNIRVFNRAEDAERWLMYGSSDDT